MVGEDSCLVFGTRQIGSQIQNFSDTAMPIAGSIPKNAPVDHLAPVFSSDWSRNPASTWFYHVLPGTRMFLFCLFVVRRLPPSSVLIVPPVRVLTMGPM